MATDNQYKKLPGSGRRSEGTWLVAVRRSRSTLWLGDDHLLAIETTGYTQQYKRFYYRDIQALIIRPTTTARTWTIVLSVIVAVAALLGFAVDDSVGTGIIWGCGAVFLIFLITNLFRGPTCETHLKTAVQTEILPSLCRLRSVEKAMVLLKERIQQSQGVLETEAAQIQARTAMDATLSQPAAAHTFYQTVQGADSVRPYKSRVHWILYGLLLLDGLFNFGTAWLHGLFMVMVSTLISLSATGVSIAALLKQDKTDLAIGIRRLSAITTAYLVLMMVIGSIQGVVLIQGDPYAANNEWLMMKRYAAIAPQDHPWLFYMLLIFGVISAGLGLLGLFLMQQFEQRRKAAAVIPPMADPQLQAVIEPTPSAASPVEPPPPVS